MLRQFLNMRAAHRRGVHLPSPDHGAEALASASIPRSHDDCCSKRRVHEECRFNLTGPSESPAPSPAIHRHRDIQVPITTGARSPVR